MSWQPHPFFFFPFPPKVFFDNTETKKPEKKAAKKKEQAYKGFDPDHPTEVNRSQADQVDQEKAALKTNFTRRESLKGFQGELLRRVGLDECWQCLQI